MSADQSVWKFRSTAEAYDCAMCAEQVKTGDVIVVESECVIGLVWTWPLAVTVDAGELHQVTPGRELAVLADARISVEAARYAVRLAVEAGWPVPRGWAELRGSG